VLGKGFTFARLHDQGETYGSDWHWKYPQAENEGQMGNKIIHLPLFPLGLWCQEYGKVSL